MDLYTQAVEYYNSTQQVDRQKYYQTKLCNLFEAPQVKKLQEQAFILEKSRDGKLNDDEQSVKIYDQSATSPF